MSLLVLGSASSTMDVARDMLKREQVTRLDTGEIEPGGVIALDQTDGRGQRGREWYSRAGEGLCVTYMLPLIGSQAAHAAEISLVAGVAVVQALCSMFCRDTAGSDEAGCGFGLKWPNDVMLRAKKLGGILVELVSDAHYGPVALIGVGINITTRRFPADLVDRSTSLALEHYHPPRARTIAAAVYETLQRCTLDHAERGLAPILQVWREFDNTTGRRYHVETARGTCVATAIGIDDSGALIVRTDDDVVALRAASGLKEVP